MASTDEVRTSHRPDPRVLLPDGRRITFDFAGKNVAWSDTANHSFDYTWALADRECHRSALTVLRGLLHTHSTAYASNCTRYIGKLISDADQSNDEPIELLSVAHLADWPARYGLASWPFVRAVLSKWAEGGLPGLAADLIEFLDSPDHFEESRPWYFALVANDPERGAFTAQELRSIINGCNAAFERGRITLEEWALTWFLIATGVRPVQIARMTLADVLINDGPEGLEITLQIPLAKGGPSPKQGRWKRKSPLALTEVLLRYLESPQFNARDPKTPLFCTQSTGVASRLRRAFASIKTASDRLNGAAIPIFPYRFRYTLGTRAIEQGASDDVAARLLTHRSTRCVQYYRAALPSLQKPIADAIGPEMAFIGKIFQGRVIGSLEEATRKGQPGAAIRDFALLVGQTLGACGTSAACHQDAPRACVLCGKFEPLLNAPWKRFARALWKDIKAETDDRIRGITQNQFDAVIEIVDDCIDAGVTEWAA